MHIEKAINNRCLVSGYTGGNRGKFRIYRHFCIRHSEAKLIIEVDREVDRCNLCKMFIKNMSRHQKMKTIILEERGERMKYYKKNL